MDNFFGFDPRTLSQEETAQSANSMDELIYKCNPKDSISEDGHYRAIIKVMYNPFDFKSSIIERQSYSMNDENGWFSAISSLTNGDKNCPIFKAWKALRYSKDPVKENWAAPTSKGGMGWFDKRSERFVTIQVIADKNKPELENKYMLWKLPKFIKTLIDGKQSPSIESGKASIPVMDLLLGRAVELDVKPGPDDKNDLSRRNREISYDLSTITEDAVQCRMPDGSPLVTDEQQEIIDNVLGLLRKAWREKDIKKRSELMTEFAASDDVKKFNTFYGTEVLPKVQQFCPNVKEEMSFKPWSDELTARVNAWLEKVTNGIDPQVPTYGSTTTTSASSETVKSGPVISNPMDAINPVVASAQQDVAIASPTTVETDADDDLPF